MVVDPEAGVTANDGQHGERTTPEVGGGVALGSLSALLAELARLPPAGGAWDSRLRPGAVFGRFELVREIGRGGLGVVYEARDRELGRSVAFKAVRAGGTVALREERLLREAETVARLSHPNIATLYDVGRTEHGPYLVLELLRGQTLEERLGQGRVPVREVLRIGVEVAQGMAHAHAQGVVHRDLKPSNVFLCEDGQVKVLDFGLAHAFGQRRADGGTPSSMAPEQWKGAPEDERTDVFALGVMLYRMLAGELPFPEDDGGQAVRSARKAPALEVPEELALGELVGKMLEKDPTRRPRDGAAVLSALSAFEKEVERSGTPSVAPVRARRRPRWRVVALVAVGILLGSGVAMVAMRRSAPLPPSVAVLPFTDMSPQHDQEYFGDGIAEEILNGLAHVEGLHVAGRTSSFSFKGKSDDLATVARRLHVGAVLEGSVRKEGSRVRITAQLVNAGDGYHLWSDTFDRELKGIFAVQEEIATAVVSALKLKLLQAPRTKERPTANPEAYNQYLLGRQFFFRNNWEDHRRAVQAYRKAVELDPAYAPPWAGLALATYWVADSAESAAAIAAGQEQARAAADKAVALRPDLADGYLARGFIRASVQWDWEGAGEDLQHALALGPENADVLYAYAVTVLRSTGRLEEAAATLRKAIEIDPLNAEFWGALGGTLVRLGKLGPGREALNRSLEISPAQSFTAASIAQTFLLEGRPAEALAVSQRSSLEIFRLWGAALAHHDLGHAKESKQLLDELIAKYAHSAAFQIAEAYAWRGEKDRAFEWLERARAQRDGGLSLLKVAPELRGLRGDPRWGSLLKAVNLPAD